MSRERNDLKLLQFAVNAIMLTITNIIHRYRSFKHGLVFRQMALHWYDCLNQRAKNDGRAYIIQFNQLWNKKICLNCKVFSLIKITFQPK